MIDGATDTAKMENVRSGIYYSYARMFTWGSMKFDMLMQQVSRRLLKPVSTFV
jgi:hypothetical protein